MDRVQGTRSLLAQAQSDPLFLAVLIASDGG